MLVGYRLLFLRHFGPNAIIFMNVLLYSRCNGMVIIC
jgi:hypothetical protein